MENNKQDLETKQESKQEKESKQEEGLKDKIEKQDLTPVLSYIGILFLVPMLLKEDEFSQFHAKQGLILFVAEVATFIVGIFPILGWIIAFFAWILWLMLSIIGIVNVLKGNQKKLPVIGKFADKFKI